MIFFSTATLCKSTVLVSVVATVVMQMKSASAFLSQTNYGTTVIVNAAVENIQQRDALLVSTLTPILACTY